LIDIDGKSLDDVWPQCDVALISARGAQPNEEVGECPVCPIEAAGSLWR
jgi:hypothetical protein